MNNNSIDNIRLELNSDKVKAAIYVVCGDTIARTVHCTVVRGGKVVDLSDAIFAEILISRADGNEGDNSVVIQGDELQYTWRTSDISAVGENICQFMVTFSDGTVLITPKFSLYVYNKTINQDKQKSFNEYTAITQQLVDATRCSEAAAESSRKALISEQNAKISADNASGIKSEVYAAVESAKAQALSAESSKLLAAQSEEEARKYALQAEDAADTSQGHSNNASQYATNAATYASNASQSASNASQYATNASQSATSASTYATNASQSATSASTSATSAEESATDAAASATLTEEYYEYIKTMALTELGTAHDNAYYGDLGNTAYLHSQSTGNPHNTTYSDVGADPSGAATTAAAGAIESAKTYIDGQIKDVKDNILTIVPTATSTSPGIVTASMVKQLMACGYPHDPSQL